VNPNRDGTVDVRLRNLEYDLTSAIKKVVYGFQSLDAVFAAMKDPVKLTLVTTPQTLPQSLKSMPDTIKKVADDIAKQSGGKFTFETVDPTASNAALTQQTLVNTFHLQPIPVSLFSQDGYYLDMLLNVGDKTQVVSPGQDLSEASVRTAIESALKRSSQGFLKMVGLWTPPAAQTDQLGQQSPGSLATYQTLQQRLGQDYSVRSIDLQSGQVSPDVDTLVVIAPQNMTDKERYAIDQYLMRGGSVIIGAGNYSIAPSPTGGLGLTPLQNGLNDVLASYGVTISPTLVMDPQNEPFPVQVARNVGGMLVQEIQAINFPFFPDIRANGMDRSQPIVSQLPAVTMNFASPVTLDQAKNANRTTSVLLKSSPNAWLTTNTQIEPNFQLYPQTGYAPEGQPSHTHWRSRCRARSTVTSGNPRRCCKAIKRLNPSAAAPSATPTPAPLTSSLLESSPDTARLVVLGSGEFVDDVVLQLSSRLTQDRYLNNLQLMQNAVDWSVADLDLLSIRSRGTASHVLTPMDQSEESRWEFFNYAIALAILIGIGVVWYTRRRNEQPIELAPTDAEKKS
jgi:ABC-2 type transport system permease protein